MIKKILSILTIASMLAVNLPSKVFAEAGCADVEFVFIRGSGEVQDYGESFLAFKEAMAEKMSAISLTTNFRDLDYPAVSVADIGVLTEAFFSGGSSGAFGESVDAGVAELKRVVNTTCSSSKFVLAGYSQGAMVISKSLPELNANKIIYAATFGDPKIFLPEGEINLLNLVPAACYDRDLSDYRRYVPDCYAYEGILGSYRPYEPEDFIGKLGAWCNGKDIMCSRFLGVNIEDHVSYVSDGLYEDASRYIFDKITTAFGIENTYYSPHDTVILIDSTGSMSWLIDQYKQRAIDFATQTFNLGGRVALYDYRDLKELYEPHKYCDFDTCTPETFQAGIDQIFTADGGDAPESLLSAAFHIMNELRWEQGATKSLIVLTDAGYHMPDVDGVTLGDVVTLSRNIDPVNIYVVTNSDNRSKYTELTDQTGGKVILSTTDFELTANEINSRYDSLPQVELSNTEINQPTIKIANLWEDEEHNFHAVIDTNATEIVVILNDAILGTTGEKELVFRDIDPSLENLLRLVPIKDGIRGDATEVTLPTSGRGEASIPLEPTANEPAAFIIPLAPDTGGKWRH